MLLISQKVQISATHVIKMLLLSGGILAFLYYGQGLIMPLFVAVIIAILLDIIVQQLNQWGFPNWLSITLSVFIMLILFGLLFWLLSSQVNTMAQDWSTIKSKATEKLNVLSEWANNTLNWNYKDYFENNQKLVHKAEALAGSFLSSLTNVLSQSLIIFVYIILFLMQKQHFISFFQKVFPDNRAISTLLKDAAQITKNYFVGKGKIMVFLFVIYYLGFTLGNVPYALFMALFAALFSIIPYLGNFIGGGVAVILSYLYSGTTPALIVIGVVAAAQLVENYILTPWIIGDQINLNPFMTIFGVLVFSSLWGVVGAVISLPLIGVLKVIFDHTKGTEAYAYLLKKEE